MSLSLMSLLSCRCFEQLGPGWVVNSVNPDQMQRSVCSSLFEYLAWLVWSLMAQSTLLRSCQAGHFTNTLSLGILCLVLKSLPILVHILLPESDKCPSWISESERKTVESISWSISTKEYYWMQWDWSPVRWPFEPTRSAWIFRVNTFMPSIP